jgi:hypothetical protein
MPERPPAGQQVGHIACYALYMDSGIERRCRKPEGHDGPHAGPPVRIPYDPDAPDLLELLRNAGAH